MISDAPTLTRPAHRDANALRWVAGYLSSLIGDQVWFVALGWAAVQAGTPSEVGLILAAGSLPRAALLLVGGALADRWGLRRTAMGSDLIRTLLLLCAAAVLLTSGPGVPVLVALAVCFGLVDAVFLPATGAMPQQLVSPDQLTRLQGMRSTAQRIADTVGAPLGGLIVAAAGVGAAFATAAITTLLSVAALKFTRVHPVQRDRQPLWREVRSGLGYVAGQDLLRALLILATIFEFGCSGAVNVGLPILSHTRGWGPGGVGAMLGAFGAGATLSALALVALRHLPHVGRIFPVLIIGMATALAGVGLSSSLVLATGCAAIVGIGAGLAGALYGSLMLTGSDSAMVARVISLSTLASLGLNPIAFALAGQIATAFGPSAPFLAGATIAALATVPAITSPALRRAELSS